MRKEDELIMAVHTDHLFGQGHTDRFHGFRRHYHDGSAKDCEQQKDYEKRILDNFVFMRRGDAENNPDYKQPIAYCMIISPSQNKVFSFQRSKMDANYFEKRLQGKWAWGVGGHVDKEDTESESTDTGSESIKSENAGAAALNPIHASLLRELKEEVGLSAEGFRKIGYINDDSTSVGKVHFGVLYAAEMNMHSQVIEPGKEISNGKLRSIEELEAITLSPDHSVETWSEIALGPLKEMLSDKTTLS